MPVRPLGMAAISSLPPLPSSTAEAISISESLAPEQKLFLPENSHQPSKRLTRVRVSRGLRALPQNQCLRAVCSNQGCHCSGRENSRTVASIRCWKPNTWAMELSTRANSRVTARVSLQLAPRPPYWRGMARPSRPLARSASRSALGVPPRVSRSTALSANCAASWRALSSGSRTVVCGWALMVSSRRLRRSCAADGCRWRCCAAGRRRVRRPGRCGPAAGRW